MTNAEGRMSNEAPRRWWVVALLLAMMSGFLFWQKTSVIDVAKAPKPHEASKALPADLSAKRAPSLPGEQMLKTYASPSTRPEDDLQAMAHVFSNLQLLVKGDAPFRMGANEEFAAALMGQNAAKEVFLKAPHACLNEKGQLVDRWGSPLFFHVRDRSRIDIRSAGPDRVMWTADDLQRQHEGEFMTGPSLPANERPPASR